MYKYLSICLLLIPGLLATKKPSLLSRSTNNLYSLMPKREVAEGCVSGYDPDACDSSSSDEPDSETEDVGYESQEIFGDVYLKDGKIIIIEKQRPEDESN